MRKSPFTKEISDEWDFLTFTERRRWLESPEESDFLARSQRLYDKTFVDGKWVVNIDDADLVTMLCSSTSMIQNNWDKAILLLDRWLHHPEIGEGNITIHGSFLSDRAKCHFMKGDFVAFLFDFKSSLNFPERVFGVIGLNSLLVLYCEYPPKADQTVSPWLKQAAILTAEKLKPGKRITGKIEMAETDAELDEILTAWKSKIAAKSRTTRIAKEEGESNSQQGEDPGQSVKG
jgi:hypothetical protein